MVLLARRRVKDDNCRVSQSDRFAHLVGNLLEAMGYRTRVSPEGPDKGIDIVVFRDELGLHPPIIKVQVKSGEGNVGRPDVQALSGAVGDKGAGLFVTLADFSNQARDFAEAKGNIRLLDLDCSRAQIAKRVAASPSGGLYGLDRTYRGLISFV
jgi:restriction endonuclease Mrr